MRFRMMMLAAVAALGALAAGQRILRVGVHPALAAPIRQIGAEYQKAHKGVTLEFLSVDSDKAHLVLGPSEADSARLFALNRVVLITSHENQRILKLAHIGLDLKLAVPDPKTVEGALAGQIISVASDTYGRDWEANVKKNGSVRADGSAAAVGLVMEAKADAALVLSSDAVPKKEQLRIVPLPPDLGRSVEMKAFLRERSSLAESFREYLFTKGNQQRLVAFGFASPLSPVSELTITYPGSMMKLFTAALGTLKQEKVGSTKGTALRAALSGKGSQVKFIGADGMTATVSMSSIRRNGGVIAPMGDGNYQVVLPGRTLKWLRRIVVS